MSETTDLEPINPARLYRYQVAADSPYFQPHAIKIYLHARIAGSDNSSAYGRITWYEHEFDGSVPFYNEKDQFEIALAPAEAQSLMDDLYRCGVRPTDTGESVGALNQALEHIKTLKEHVRFLSGIWNEAAD